MDLRRICAVNTPGGEVATTPLAHPAGRGVWSAALLRNLGPYAVLVLLVPGGSLIAVMLALYRSLRSSSPAVLRGEL
jgi:hypothetical protein